MPKGEVYTLHVSYRTIVLANRASCIQVGVAEQMG